MKKLVIKLASCLIVLTFLFSLFISKPTLSANQKSKLYDVSVSFEDVYLKNKVRINISFKTEESLSYLKVTSTLTNGQKEVSFESGRENEGTLKRVIPENVGDLWSYYLEFDIEYMQIGTLQIEFEYSFDLLKEEVYENTFYVPGESWIEKDQITGVVVVMGGIMVFGLSILGTYVIVSFSKTKVFYIEKEYNEDNKDEK